MARPKCLPELRPLSFREETLCQEYVERGLQDSLSAYIAAGYHPTTDNGIAIACNKLAEPKIKRRINEIIALKEVKQEISSEWVVKEHLDIIKEAKIRTPKDLMAWFSNVVKLGESLALYKQVNQNINENLNVEIDEEIKKLADQLDIKKLLIPANNEDLRLPLGDCKGILSKSQEKSENNCKKNDAPESSVNPDAPNTGGSFPAEQVK